MASRTGPWAKSAGPPSARTTGPDHAEFEPVRPGGAASTDAVGRFRRFGGDPRQGESAPDLTGEARIGDPTVSAAELRSMGNLVATRHLLALLARRRADLSRDAVIDEVAGLLAALDEGPYARRLLLQMAEVGRIVDIYPLEVTVRIMERHPAMLPRMEFGPVVLNHDEIEARRWPVGEVVPLKVPLNLKMKAFALDGGGTPGYALAPGPPATYHLEFGASGTYSLLFRGEVRKVSRIGRLTVRVEDPPEPAR